MTDVEDSWGIAADAVAGAAALAGHPTFGWAVVDIRTVMLEGHAGQVGKRIDFAEYVAVSWQAWAGGLGKELELDAGIMNRMVEM